MYISITFLEKGNLAKTWTTFKQYSCTQNFVPLHGELCPRKIPTAPQRGPIKPENRRSHFALLTKISLHRSCFRRVSRAPTQWMDSAKSRDLTRTHGKIDDQTPQIPESSRHFYKNTIKYDFKNHMFSTECQNTTRPMTDCQSDSNPPYSKRCHIPIILIYRLSAKKWGETITCWSSGLKIGTS